MERHAAPAPAPNPGPAPLPFLSSGPRLPALFVSHGMPTLVLERDGPLALALAAFVRDLPQPRAALVLSAHWTSEGPLRVTAGVAPPTLHDFDDGSFPELEGLSYFCPGSPEVAAEVVQLLADAGIATSPHVKRGLDHGAWVPMMLAYPHGRVPVLQLSLPLGADPEKMRRLGRALAPLRDRDVLLVGSGGAVHNLERVRFDAGGESSGGAGAIGHVDPWADAFDSWLGERLAEGDLDAILEYRERAPFADLAHPTSEHFDPLLAIAATAGDDDVYAPLHAGIRHGSLSMRSFAVTTLARRGR